MFELLAQLQVHLVLHHLTLDGITTFVCLITHLKCDILQPQPINESNPTNVPTILRQPITRFLGKALSIPFKVMNDFWTIMRGYAWEMLTMVLIQDDYDLFKQWGWLVFSSPVKSSFFLQNEATGNCNWSKQIQIFRDCNQTLKDWS